MNGDRQLRDPSVARPPERSRKRGAGRLSRVLLGLLALLLGTPLLRAADPPPPEKPPLESIAAIRRLKTEQFGQRIPVRVRGTITFAGPPQGTVVDGFLHDGTNGIYFAGSAGTTPTFRLGDVVEVDGSAVPGSFAPMVWHQQIKVLGTNALPEPRRASVRELLSHPDDCNRVEISGMVEFAVDLPDGWTDLAMESDGVLMVARAPTTGLGPLGTRRVGARLQLRGVSTGVFSPHRKMVALRVLVPNAESIDVLKLAPESPTDEPTVPIDSLFGFNPDMTYRERTWVEGVVTSLRGSSEYFVQDTTGGLLVRDPLMSSYPGRQVRPGDRLRISGQLEIGGLQPILVLPQVFRKAEEALPPARPVTAEQLISGEVSGLRVELEAIVNYQQRSTPDSPAIVSCTVSNVPLRIFKRSFQDNLPEMPPSSRIRVRGTCLHVAESFVFRTAPIVEMHLASPEDLTVLSRPFVWTARRVGVFAGGLGLAGVMAVGWGLTLRRQVQARTRELQQINDLLKTESNAQQVDLASKADALRRSEERLSLVLDATEDGFWDWDIPANQCFYGKAWLQMLGYRPGELPADVEAWEGLIHPDDRERVLSESRRFLLGETPRFEMEYRLRHRNGHWIWVLDRARVVARDAHGKAIRAVGAHTNITDYRRLTLLLGLALEAGQVGYWDHHVPSDSLEWGGHWLLLLGYQSGEMPRTAGGFMEWVHPDQRAPVWERYLEFLRQPNAGFEMAFQVRARDGRWRWVLTRARVAERDLQGAPLRVIGIHVDTDRQMQAELALRQKSAELEMGNLALQRAARARDEFLANMSHELRTPLTSILTLSELLIEEVHGPLNSRQARTIQSIESSGRHLLELINQVLDVARFDAGNTPLEIQACDAGELARTVGALLEPQARRKGLTLEVLTAPEKAQVKADPLRLKQVIVNLIGNAIKFTPPGGRVTLNIESTPTVVIFRVTDTGIGISPDKLEDIFRPFVQLDTGLNRKHEGSGLGLAIAKRFTELQGGTLEVASTPGRGSCFSVTLPRADAPVTAAPVRPASPVPVLSR